MKKNLYKCSRHFTSFIRIILAAAWLTATAFSNACAQDDTDDLSDYEAPEEIDPSLLNANVSEKQSNKLWTARIAWTNRLMLYLADENPSNTSMKRLLKKQDAVDEAVELFYSDNIGQKLSQFLNAHQAIAEEMKQAQLSGDNEAHADACQRLRLNKKELMEFIEQANSLYVVALQEEGH
jgi:hypothetical protein